MTYEEALISCDMICTECQQIKGNKCDKENCANEFKRKALEKQIPKKPLKIKGEYRDKFICPACKSQKVMAECDPCIDYGLTYCNNCGQRLDWSE